MNRNIKGFMIQGGDPTGMKQPLLMLSQVIALQSARCAASPHKEAVPMLHPVLGGMIVSVRRKGFRAVNDIVVL